MMIKFPFRVYSSNGKNTNISAQNFAFKKHTTDYNKYQSRPVSNCLTSTSHMFVLKINFNCSTTNDMILSFLGTPKFIIGINHFFQAILQQTSNVKPNNQLFLCNKCANTY